MVDYAQRQGVSGGCGFCSSLPGSTQCNKQQPPSRGHPLQLRCSPGVADACGGAAAGAAATLACDTSVWDGCQVSLLQPHAC